MTPLPGDPSVVRAESAQLLKAAETIRKAAQMLARIGRHGEMTSEAIDELRTKAADTSDVLTFAAVRYQGTGNALHDYAPVLDQAQKQAKQAIGQLATTNVGAAREAVHRADLDPWEHVSLSEEEKSQRKVDLANAQAELADQERIEAAAWALYEDAKRDVEVAAKTAMDKIQSAMDISGLNDSPMDDIKGFVDKYVVPVLEAITKVLDVVSDILGLIAVILAFIPGLQALAAAIGGLSLALKGISLVITALLALAGKKTWGEVLGKAITLAISIVVKGGAAKAMGKIRAIGKLRNPGSLLQGMKGAKILSPGDPGYAKAMKGVFKFSTGMGVKYGAKFTEGSWDAKYDVNITQAIVDSGYREKLTFGDYFGEVINVVSDPTGYLGKELGGGAGYVGEVTFDAMTAPPSLDSQPVRVGAFHTGAGGGGGGGGW